MTSDIHVFIPSVAGRTITVAVVLDKLTYTIFLDQKEVARFDVPADLGRTEPQLHVQGDAGSVKLVGLRYYALP